MSKSTLDPEIGQIVTDLAAYRELASRLGSHKAALIVHLRRAGLSRQPRRFVREFCAVDIGHGEYPTVVCYVPSGAWASFYSPFGAVVEDLEGRPDKDENLVRVIEFLDLYRRGPNHPFLRAERS